MLKRQKILLYLISELKRQSKKITKTTLDKTLFLLKKETEIENHAKFYSFFPHYYGPFSNQFYFDLTDLQSKGYLDKGFSVKLPEMEINDSLSSIEKELIQAKLSNLANKDLVKYVYDKYPEYTVKSVLKEHKEINKNPGIFTIGYEKKNIDDFLDTLIQNNIDTVVDVRANAFSMNFTFTKAKLEHYLEKSGIKYMHIPELGIEGKHRKELNGDDDYSNLFHFYSKEILPKQSDKVKLLNELGKSNRIALLCFEQDEKHCHRGTLGKELETQYGIAISHL